MPIYNVQIVQKVHKKVDAAGNEHVSVDRVVVSVIGVVAASIQGACAIAGMSIPEGYDKELLSSATVTIQQVA